MFLTMPGWTSKNYNNASAVAKIIVRNHVKLFSTDSDEKQNHIVNEIYYYYRFRTRLLGLESEILNDNKKRIIMIFYH